MNRQDLQAISRIRQRDARVLLKAKQWPGAYYIIGYSVECALKACIAKSVRRHDFPDKQLATKVFTHDLQELLKLAGLAPQLAHDSKVDGALSLNWTIAKDWSESKRYEYKITEGDARDLYRACTENKSGVLSWLRKKW